MTNYIMIKFTEALNLSNTDDVVSSILIGNVGEKVPQELKDYADTDDIKADIEGYFSLANAANVDKSKVMQVALKVACHSEDPVDSFKRWSTRELIPNIVNYSSSDWLKSNDLYKALSEKGRKLSLHELENLRGFIKDESLRHGKSTKGSGKKKNNGVELLYKDPNWILLTPKSWDAEKKIAYFTNPKGEKEKCHWCTASGDDISWYNSYTYNNTKPLYVMINKEDKAWQLAYYPAGHRVEFLDSYDHQDDFTRGGWMKELPREMMSKIVNEFNGKSMIDFVDRYKLSNDDEFEVKFLPWVKIIGKARGINDDFSSFMMDNTIAPVGKAPLDLFISIRTRPSDKEMIKFKITNNGPEIIDVSKLHTFTKIEQRFIRTALLQYTAECMNLDIDYMDKFDSLLSELKEMFNK